MSKMNANTVNEMAQSALTTRAEYKYVGGCFCFLDNDLLIYPKTGDIVYLKRGRDRNFTASFPMQSKTSQMLQREIRRMNLRNFVNNKLGLCAGLCAAMFVVLISTGTILPKHANVLKLYTLPPRANTIRQNSDSEPMEPEHKIPSTKTSGNRIKNTAKTYYMNNTFGR